MLIFDLQIAEMKLTIGLILSHTALKKILTLINLNSIVHEITTNYLTANYRLISLITD